jgi:hypothetical protein
VSFPNDPYLVPFLTMEQPGGPFDPKAPTRVTTELLKQARLIDTAEERSLALQRIANGAIASDQLALAHNTLEEAMTTASEVHVPLVRDQRLIAIVTSLTALTDALLRDRRENLIGPMVPPDADAAKPEALPKTLDGSTLIRLARLEWQRGVYLATVISNPTYRNEMLYKVAESEASGSASIANELLKSGDVDSLADRPPAGGRDAQDKAPANVDEKTRARQAQNKSLKEQADSILVTAFDDAKKIDRLIWKYRAMVRIALAAADSQQYSRGVALARDIDNGESRAEAMLILAESQCRNTDAQVEAATATYQAAAEAMATVQQDGLRGVLAGFLVDSLISTGRFDDARACIGLFPEQSQRLVALGSVAEAQGRRGGAEAARRWIADEIPQQYRAPLYRRVVTGVLWAVDQNRSKEFLRPDSTAPMP